MEATDQMRRRAGRGLLWAAVIWAVAAAPSVAAHVPVSFRDIGAAAGARFASGASLDYEAIAGRFLADVAWTRAPTYAETAAAYPAKARDKGVAGRATLDCAFTKAGTLTACAVVQQGPAGYGFGEAALSLATRFAARQALADGRSVEGAGVQVEFAFDPEMLAGAEPVVGQPQWTSLPTVEDFTAALPADASKAGVDALVVLDCKVEADGGLGGCKVASEEPSGHALGQAALTLAPKFRVKVWTDDGLPVIGGALRTPIRVKVD